MGCGGGTELGGTFTVNGPSSVTLRDPLRYGFENALNGTLSGSAGSRRIVWNFHGVSGVTWTEQTTTFPPTTTVRPGSVLFGPRWELGVNLRVSIPFPLNKMSTAGTSVPRSEVGYYRTVLSLSLADVLLRYMCDGFFLQGRGAPTKESLTQCYDHFLQDDGDGSWVTAHTMDMIHPDEMRNLPMPKPTLVAEGTLDPRLDTDTSPVSGPCVDGSDPKTFFSVYFGVRSHSESVARDYRQKLYDNLGIMTGMPSSTEVVKSKLRNTFRVSMENGPWSDDYEIWLQSLPGAVNGSAAGYWPDLNSCEIFSDADSRENAQRGWTLPVGCWSLLEVEEVVAEERMETVNMMPGSTTATTTLAPSWSGMRCTVGDVVEAPYCGPSSLWGSAVVPRKMATVSSVSGGKLTVTWRDGSSGCTTLNAYLAKKGTQFCTEIPGSCVPSML